MSVSVTEIATGGQVAHPPWQRVERRERTLRFMLEIGLLAALYYGSAKLGYELGFSGPVAAIVVVPFALAWSRPRSRLSHARTAELVLMLATTGALTALAFSTPKALEYLAFPGLIWAGLRFGQRGATLALALVTGVAIWSVRNVDGPFHFHSITHSILS